MMNYIIITSFLSLLVPITFPPYLATLAFLVLSFIHPTFFHPFLLVFGMSSSSGSYLFRLCQISSHTIPELAQTFRTNKKISNP